MRLVFLSDFHLSVGDDRDDFHADKALSHLLRLHKNDYTILNGDIVEGQQRLFTPLSTYLRRVEHAHPMVCEAIEKYADLIIPGNHDPSSMKSWCGIPVGPKIFSYGPVVATHGQEFDWFLTGPLSYLATVAVPVAGLLELLIHSDADLWLSKLLELGRFGEPDTYRIKAIDLLFEYSAEFVVLGHTHHFSPTDARGYGNCGHLTGSADEVEDRLSRGECSIVIDV